MNNLSATQHAQALAGSPEAQNLLGSLGGGDAGGLAGLAGSLFGKD